MADGRTIVFFPEGAYGPTNNCVGIGQVLRERGHRVVFIVEESFAGNLEAQGVRGAADAPRPAARGARDPRPVLDRLHPGHGAGVPQADDRAAGRVHRPHVPGPHRRREVRPAAARGDRRRAPAGRDRRGQRRQLPGDHVDAPRRGSACCRATRPRSRTRSCAPFSSGYPAADRSRVAGVPRRGRPDAPRDVDDFDAFCRERGLPALPWTSTGPDFMHESPFLNIYSYPAEADYDAIGAARPDVAPAGLDGPRRRHDVAAAATSSRAATGR